MLWLFWWAHLSFRRFRGSSTTRYDVYHFEIVGKLWFFIPVVWSPWLSCQLAREPKVQTPIANVVAVLVSTLDFHDISRVVHHRYDIYHFEIICKLLFFILMVWFPWLSFQRAREPKVQTSLAIAMAVLVRTLDFHDIWRVVHHLYDIYHFEIIGKLWFLSHGVVPLVIFPMSLRA